MYGGFLKSSSFVIALFSPKFVKKMILITQTFPEEADHYSFRIKITGGNGKKLTFKGKVYSLDETKKGIMGSQEVFTLFDGQSRRFEVENKINFEITLYYNKEEIKNDDVESGISEDEEQ
jgi:hypothetical protein